MSSIAVLIALWPLRIIPDTQNNAGKKRRNYGALFVDTSRVVAKVCRCFSRLVFRSKDIRHNSASSFNCNLVYIQVPFDDAVNVIRTAPGAHPDGRLACF